MWNSSDVTAGLSALPVFSSFVLSFSLFVAACDLPINPMWACFDSILFSLSPSTSEGCLLCKGISTFFGVPLTGPPGACSMILRARCTERSFCASIYLANQVLSQFCDSTNIKRCECKYLPLTCILYYTIIIIVTIITIIYI